MPEFIITYGDILCLEIRIKDSGIQNKKQEDGRIKVTPEIMQLIKELQQLYEILK